MVAVEFLPEAIRSPNNCQVDPIPGFKYPYGYRPSLAAGVVFCVLFGIAFFGHSLQTIRLRRWTSVLLAIGALTELIGWAGRTWSAECPYNRNAFLIQITTLIIGPVFYTAALYVLLGMFIKALGREYSILSARMYTIVFMTSDTVSLVVQAVGGAMASTASSKGNDPKLGTNIMVAGVIFQLVAMTIFTIFTLDFLRRSAKFGMPQEYNKIIVALFISLAAIFARSIFRAIELMEGWNGYLMMHEPYFIALDGALMVLAVVIFLPFDPARTIPETYHAAQKDSGELSEFSTGA
ncbi:RTA1-domain-containing protein [Annulohypoxylon maeteangense]|uniref:RTA1-domain-containing protein n=1 Tax=Annulohypoxylon maeteangense TaxID=1927788 RepID=UPI0020079FAF|nr:RTA1-domain-containing protein [Annulohypoxylon maeteangense]KAI0881328.1 RTA1-domain-containing protein [Annulohypoxylon maeteangense]